MVLGIPVYCSCALPRSRDAGALGGGGGAFGHTAKRCFNRWASPVTFDYDARV